MMYMFKTFVSLLFGDASYVTFYGWSSSDQISLHYKRSSRCL